MRPETMIKIIWKMRLNLHYDFSFHLVPWATPRTNLNFFLKNMNQLKKIKNAAVTKI